ncbi:MAG: SdpI family protein [Acidimicrobiales bacterium]|nr:SdpI family protein [Acidimicrobiales bacterium]
MLGWLWLSTGLLVGGVGVAATAGRLPRQHWAGIRLPSTMRSEAAWYAAHRAGGPWIVAAGATSLVAGAVMVLARPGDALVGAVSIGVAAAVLVLTLIGGAAGVRAARGR